MATAVKVSRDRPKPVSNGGKRLKSALAEAIDAGRIGGRLWFYTNYHCNLACRYCLTSSAPDVPRRMLDRRIIDAIADQAVTLGFRSFGVTGGEPFMRTDMAEMLASLGRRLPTVVLTNGTLFTDRLIASLAPLTSLPVDVQISLDSADGAANDAVRGAGGFDSVVRAVPRLAAAGIHVRIGSTVDGGDLHALERLCAFHRELGVSEDDHVVRPIIRRGRAWSTAIGVAVSFEDLPAELTLTAEGAFWSPAAPSVTDGVPDVDYLLTRTVCPLAVPAQAMVRTAHANPMREPALRVT
ncbi:MAG: radical SAM protein [Vulcanimicrobiaceae bacterium]